MYFVGMMGCENTKYNMLKTLAYWLFILVITWLTGQEL